MMVSRIRARTTTSVALAAVALTCTAAPALAQSGVDGYGPKNISPQVLGQTEGTGDNNTAPEKTVSPAPPQNTTSPTPVKKASGNELPFTGLDIGLVAAAGAALLGAGAGMRRLTRAPDVA